MSSSFIQKCISVKKNTFMKYKSKEIISTKRELIKIDTDELKINTDKINKDNKYRIQCNEYKEQMKILKLRKEHYQNKLKKLTTQIEDMAQVEIKVVPQVNNTYDTEPPAKKQMDS